MTQHYTIRSDQLTARLDPDGARLRSLRMGDGPNLVLDVEDDVTPALRDCYGGTIVGPLANRVRDGKVRIGGMTYQMPCNENDVTALHSGPAGLDRALWTVADHSDTGVHLTHTLADGHGGLPGHRALSVRFSIHENSLTLQIDMTTDAPTPASIAHHPYWRVAPDHQLFIDANRYLPTDDTNLPTGAIEDVAGTPFDHRRPRPIDPGTDHNFCVSMAPTAVPRTVAVLETPGLRLDIASTEPGLQAYSGAFLPDIPDAGIAPLSGIALEPQGWPNAVNTTAFPDVICTPDHPYSQTTRYTLHSAT